ncbi:phosphoribosyl-AMP cyclohydrolase [Nisaea sp.]|uniref:phosphoribosyl-AMP cyclohydrolase n=1 Tax=Nisaea sp. TaxID=2024842 RepID=UPI0032985637
MTTDTLFSERGDKADMEEGTTFQPKFDADGLIPCVTQHAETGEVLMFAFMNRESLAKTLELGEAVYWSRSRAEIWHKGATSGHVQKVVELRTDCDQDVVLLRVLSGPACHVGYNSCFYRAARIENGKAVLAVVKDGKAYDPEAVYGKKG